MSRKDSKEAAESLDNVVARLSEPEEAPTLRNLVPRLSSTSDDIMTLEKTKSSKNKKNTEPTYSNEATASKSDKSKTAMSTKNEKNTEPTQSKEATVSESDESKQKTSLDHVTSQLSDHHSDQSISMVPRLSITKNQPIAKEEKFKETDKAASDSSEVDSTIPKVSPISDQFVTKDKDKCIGGQNCSELNQSEEASDSSDEVKSILKPSSEYFSGEAGKAVRAKSSPKELNIDEVVETSDTMLIKEDSWPTADISEKDVRASLERAVFRRIPYQDKLKADAAKASGNRSAPISLVSNPNSEEDCTSDLKPAPHVVGITTVAKARDSLDVLDIKDRRRSSPAGLEKVEFHQMQTHDEETKSENEDKSTSKEQSVSWSGVDIIRSDKEDHKEPTSDPKKSKSGPQELTSGPKEPKSGHKEFHDGKSAERFGWTVFKEKDIKTKDRESEETPDWLHAAKEPRKEHRDSWDGMAARSLGSLMAIRPHISDSDIANSDNNVEKIKESKKIKSDEGKSGHVGHSSGREEQSTRSLSDSVGQSIRKAADREGQSTRPPLEREGQSSSLPPDATGSDSSDNSLKKCCDTLFGSKPK